MSLRPHDLFWFVCMPLHKTARTFTCAYVLLDMIPACGLRLGRTVAPCDNFGVELSLIVFHVSCYNPPRGDVPFIASDTVGRSRNVKDKRYSRWKADIVLIDISFANPSCLMLP